MFVYQRVPTLFCYVQNAGNAKKNHNLQPKKKDFPIGFTRFTTLHTTCSTSISAECSPCRAWASRLAPGISSIKVHQDSCAAAGAMERSAASGMPNEYWLIWRGGSKFKPRGTIDFNIGLVLNVLTIIFLGCPMTWPIPLYPHIVYGYGFLGISWNHGRYNQQISTDINKYQQISTIFHLISISLWRDLIPSSVHV